MKLSIRQLLSESWDDFKKLIVNPVILILFIAYPALALALDLIAETSPFFGLITILWSLLLLCIYASIIKMLYNIKKGESQNIFSEILPLFPRYLWYTLIFTGIIMLTMLVVFIPGVILYGIMGKEAIWVWFLVGAIYIPVFLYLFIRLFFYTYLIIIEKDKTPMATSWGISKQYFGKLALLFLLTILITAVPIISLELYLKYIYKMENLIIHLIVLPLNIIISPYMTILLLNTFLFCRAQYKSQPIVVEEEPQIN